MGKKQLRKSSHNIRLTISKFVPTHTSLVYDITSRNFTTDRPTMFKDLQASGRMRFLINNTFK